MSFSLADTSDSLLSSSALSLSTSSISLDSLADSLVATNSPFDNDTNWTTFPTTSDSPHLLGDNTLLPPSAFLTTAQDDINVLAMTSAMIDMHDIQFSAPMIKGKQYCNMFVIMG